MNGRKFIGASALTMALMLGAAGTANADHIDAATDIEACQDLIPAVVADIDAAESLSLMQRSRLQRKTTSVYNKLQAAIDKMFPVSGRVKHDDGEDKINQALEKALALDDKIDDLLTHDKIHELEADAILTTLGAVIFCLENTLEAETL